MEKHICLLKLAVLCSCLLFNSTKASCPAVPAEDLFPCFCFHDTSDLICRGGEGRHIDNDVLLKITNILRNFSDTRIGKLTLSQTEITSISEETFASLHFSEVVIRFNEKLRSVHPKAFDATKDYTRNFSFGELGTPYEVQNMQPLDVSFLKGFSKLQNLFLSGFNMGSFSREIFAPLATSEPLPKFYFIGLALDCGCGNKWIFDESILTKSQRKQLLGSSNSPQIPPLMCRSMRIPGLMMPIRSFSSVDFNHCSQ